MLYFLLSCYHLDEFTMKRSNEMASVPCIPTFSSKLGVITDPSNILSYIVNFYITVPAGYLDVNSRYEKSLAIDVAETGHSADTLKTRITESLTTLITNYFSTQTTLNVEVSFLDSDDVDDTVTKYIRMAVGMQYKGVTYTFDENTLIRLKGE